MGVNMSAQGIEHRTVDAVMNAFDFFETPKFALYVGNIQKYCYENDDINDARDKLQQALTMIHHGGTTATYNLRIYDIDTKKIVSNTPHKGCTTFKLNEWEVNNTNVRRTNDGGVIVVDNGNRQLPAPAVSQDVLLRLERLETENATLRENIIKAEIEALKQSYEARIGAITAAPPPEKDFIGKIGDIVADKPEIITNIFQGLTGLFTSMAQAVKGNQPPPAPEPQQYMYQEVPMQQAPMQYQAPGTQPAPAISGTEMDLDELINDRFAQTNFFTPNPAATGATAAASQDNINIMQNQTITEAEMEAFHDRQEAALDALEEKVGIGPLTEALEKLAGYNTTKIEMLLKMM